MNDQTIKLFGSRNSDEWETPQDRWEEWDKEFHFDLDAAASPENKKCFAYFSKEGSALIREWFGNVWCNPPYSQIEKFLKKGEEEIKLGHCELIVFLTFANTDTKWFWNHCYRKPNVEIRFIKGRLKFKNGDKHNSAMRPSMLAIMRKQ